MIRTLDPFEGRIFTRAASHWSAVDFRAFGPCCGRLWLPYDAEEEKHVRCVGRVLCKGKRISKISLRNCALVSQVEEVIQRFVALAPQDEVNAFWAIPSGHPTSILWAIDAFVGCKPLNEYRTVCKVLPT
jgi:hypothetical protein